MYVYEHVMPSKEKIAHPPPLNVGVNMEDHRIARTELHETMMRNLNKTKHLTAHNTFKSPDELFCKVGVKENSVGYFCAKRSAEKTVRALDEIGGDFFSQLSVSGPIGPVLCTPVSGTTKNGAVKHKLLACFSPEVLQ